MNKDLLQTIANWSQIIGTLMSGLSLFLAFRVPGFWQQIGISVRYAAIGSFIFLGLIYLLSSARLIIRFMQHMRTQDVQSPPIGLWAWNLSLGALTILVGSILLFVVPSSVPSKNDALPGTVSISSVEFMTGGWNPRLVDFRTLMDSGIPVYENATIEFRDIWIQISGDSLSPSSWVWIEVYSDQQLANLVGVTEATEMVRGFHSLGAVRTEDENLDDVTEWRVRPEWIGENLYFVIVVEAEGTHKVTDIVQLKLEQGGTSWLLDAPYATISVIQYRIDEGKSQSIEASTAIVQGIEVTAGSHLTIEGFVYRSRSSKVPVHVEAYLFHDDEILEDTFRQAQEVLLQIERGSIELEPELEWEIPANQTQIALSILDDDKTIVDRLAIPLTIREHSTE